MILKTRLAYARAWHFIDVGTDSRSLGRLASSIAIFLMGKHKPIWDPSTDCGDYVVAVGCHDLHTTGKKRLQKQYYTHNTRPGGLKQMSMDKMFEKWGGGEVLKKAVSGMLPKNRLRDKRLDRLKGEDTLHVFLLYAKLSSQIQSLRRCCPPFQGKPDQIRRRTPSNANHQISRADQADISTNTDTIFLN